MEAARTIVDLPDSGRVLAGYRIGDALGQGGMGAVVSATEVASGRSVAIKFLKPERSDDPSMVTRFRREARVCEGIVHENVVRVLSSGSAENGLEYLVMERLDGEDLAAHLAAHGPLSVADAIRFVRDAARGVAAAHAIGIVHRDLKPQNLFLAEMPDGSRHVKVLDFGISKLIHDEIAPPTLTTTGSLVGSPHYMAPEQLTTPRDVDARCDVWSLGAVLYKLLTNQVPFDGPSVPVIFVNILQTSPVPLAKLRPDVPIDLARLVDRCLEKDPVARVPSMMELVRALDAITAGTPAFDAGSFDATLPVRRPAAALSSHSATPVVATITSPALPPRRGQRWVAFAIAGALASSVAVTAIVYVRPASRPPPPVVAIALPPPPTAALEAPIASAEPLRAPIEAPSSSVKPSSRSRGRARTANGAADDMPNERK